METSRRKTRRAGGFTLLEVMIAVVILAVGLLGVAALLAKLSGTTNDSRYLSTQVMLASEKLEDLSRLATGDPNLGPGGNLAANAPGYFDQVQVSSSGKNGNATNTDSVVVNDSITGTATPAVANDMQLYTRRWVVEGPLSTTPGAPLTTGVLRLTVIVIPSTGSAQEQAQTFQVSMVRPL